MTKLFPTLSDENMRRLLAPPDGPVRVVIDTDARNEIDDQFALAWALLSLDQMRLEGIYAAPYTHPSTPPAEGMELSYQEILTVVEKVGADVRDKVFRGSPAHLMSLDEPIHSPAVEHLIACALSGVEEPLYVAAIGCVSNIASAILLEPRVIEHMVVVWTSAYPSCTSLPNEHSFNLRQDPVASRLLFDCGVPQVYLPGFHVGAQLRLSLPEMEAWVAGKGAIGDYLHHLYTHNPLRSQRGITDHLGRSWIIWDLITIAWLLNPAWVPSHLVRAPMLNDALLWEHPANRHLMREAYGIERDAIFRDFFHKLAQAG